MFVAPDKINLLYIEDDKALPNVITQCLNTSECIDFNVVVRETLEDGIKYLEDIYCIENGSCGIDIILLDLVLPNSEGVDTFKLLKEKCNFLPIVVISGYEDMAYECMKLGAQDYLVKPDINPSSLIKAIKYSIARVKLENEFKNIIRTSSLGYHMYKLEDDKLIFCGYNPASNEILGVDNNQFLNKEITEAFPNLSTEIPKMYRRAIEEGIPWTNQVVEYEDGSIGHACFRLNAYRTAKNHLTVTFEDITEQIKIQEALTQSEAKYRHLVEVTGAIVFEIDYISRKFTYVNDVMCKQLGWSREELLNMGPADVLTGSSMIDFIERQNALAHGEHIDNVHEYEGIRKDGSTFWALVTSEFIQDENGNIISGNAVAIDVTNQKLIEESLKRKEAEVFMTLEGKIREWKEELITRNVKTKKHLRLIDKEILSMNNVGEVG